MGEKSSKRIGLGSFSIVFCVIAIIFAGMNINFYNHEKTLKLGEMLLQILKIPISYNIITILILVLALYIGIKYKQHYFAKAGRIVSTILLVMFVIIFILAGMQRVGILG